MTCKKQKDCNCSYPCDKKGLCCECIAYHRKRGELPACYFSEEKEKTYDRSISNYLH
ncbi:hypothetical protein HOD38_05685 [archaeon]|jgi:hypothetical protein|nr:hypothetical protein [archaeon]MBT4397733.1 hypothetical protein [archaeon]MBT4441218.1 hypothetical protein [archaeon]